MSSGAANDKAVKGGSDGARICIAAFAAPHGVGGRIKVHTYADDPLAVVTYGPPTTEDGDRSFEIAAVGVWKAGIVVTVAGIKSREDAALLTGTKLYVPRAALPATDDEDEFYWSDLIGLAARIDGQAAPGTVLAVHDYGAGPLLEIQPAVGKAELVPFTKEAVPTVDLTGGFVAVVPPAGLLGVPGADDDETPIAEKPVEEGPKRPEGWAKPKRPPKRRPKTRTVEPENG